jgi:ATP-dependent DNA helicase RecG
MWRSPEAKPADPFQQWLDRVSRPIDFASRDAFAHLPTVKNLNRFVSAQVVQALSDRVYPRTIETGLLRLRELFVDNSSGLPPKEQQRRLREASEILTTLRAAAQNPAEAWQAVGNRGGRMPAGSTPKELWKIPVRFVKGVGPQRMTLLNRMGIQTVEDALWTVPWRYEDRSVMTPIETVAIGDSVSICGTIIRSHAKRARRRRLAILEVTVEDETGSVQAVFFNQSYLEQLFTVGTRVMITGRIVAGARGWIDRRIDVSQYEVLDEESESPLHVGRIVPIYHETKGWTSRQMRVLISGLLDQHKGDLQEILPIPLRARYRLPPIQHAIEEVHFPRAGTDADQLARGLTAAHRRLAVEELFLLQLALASRQRVVKEEAKQVRFSACTALLAKLTRLLTFRLTAAQERVIEEIQRDMLSLSPMNRLVQGDVGSGKTIVALHAIVTACGSGYQAALMAPTEILAEQHYRNMKGLLDSLGLTAALVTAGGRATARNSVREQVASGEAQVVIGTHALIQQRTVFAKLGLAIVDEQHRFGVLQRKTLIEKGYRPDVLVLTATPIPRTLAMTAYGDLDVSVIDAMPPGRKQVRTLLFGEAQRRRAYQIIRDELRSSRQAYVVYPLVEESEKTDLQAAIQEAEQLQRREFADFRVGLLHGRLKSDEKERIMTAYKRGEIHVLVATTVVEVGVDVPNASVIMIEHAERFGLAQLHQLRGRVGRSGNQSYCLLMASSGTLSGWSKAKTAGESLTASRERLEALVRSTDGFVIAEEDLRIRGPGEFFGLRQWGLPEFHVANLIRDADLLQQVRLEAFALLRQDPYLKAPPHQKLREAMVRKWDKKLDLGSVS